MPRRPAKAMTATKAPAKAAPAKKAPAKKAAPKAKIPEAKRFKREANPVLEITEPKAAAEAMRAYKAYLASADALERAKTKAFEREEVMKQLMGGHDTLIVNGLQIATWRWANASEFDKASAEADPMWPQVDGFMRKYTKTVVGKTRRFLCKGVAHVD